jgi:hypothetical protein
MDIYSQSIRKNYDDNVRGAVAAVKGNLLSQKTIRQNGVEGRDIVVDIPQKGQEGQVHVRYLWIGNRFYQIMFSGKPGTATAPNVEAFLASFRTTK